MNNLLKSLLVAAALSIGATRALAVTNLTAIGDLYSTGTDASNIPVVGNGAADLHYTLTTNPQGTGPFVTTNGDYPLNGTWVANGSSGTVSRWISPQADYAPPGSVSDATGDYVYQTTFTLTNRDLTTASIYVTMAADDSVNGITINGHAVTGSAVAFPAQTAFHPVLIQGASLFQSGVNTLQFSVHNNVFPTGLNAYLTGGAFPIFSSGTQITNVTGGLYNSGVANNGSLLAAAAADPHWALITNPQGTGPVVTTNGDYPLNGGWSVGEGTTSQWISPQADYAGPPLGHDLPGNYVYQTTFDLSSFDPTSAVIVGRISTDDAVVGITLNGVSQNVAGGGFFKYTYFTLSGFISGINTIDITVNNMVIQGNPNFPGNPTGMRVEFSGVANPTIATVPLPAAVALFPVGLAVAGFCKRRLSRKA